MKQTTSSQPNTDEGEIMGHTQFLVTGATGATGGYAVERLLERGHAVRALAHREDERSKRLEKMGAEVLVGDLLKLNYVRTALGGIRRAYFVYPLSPTLVQATVIFAQAAKEAGVEIVANMSQWNSRPSAKSPATISHWLSEQVLDWSAVPVAHLRATIFSEWLLWVSRSIRQGVMMLPWDGNSRWSPVATEDLAQVIVAILENPATHSGKTYRLCGPAEHSFAEVAEIASRVLGTQIKYQQASVDTFAESVGQTGNALFKDHIRAVAVEAQEGVFAGTNSLAAEISGRPPMTIEEFVAKNRAEFV
jgi:NAD(P)H dehydrogenase (quinone)